MSGRQLRAMNVESSLMSGYGDSHKCAQDGCKPLVRSVEVEGVGSCLMLQIMW